MVKLGLSIDDSAPSTSGDSKAAADSDMPPLEEDKPTAGVPAGESKMEEVD
jgi:hypothetical protein